MKETVQCKDSKLIQLGVAGRAGLAFRDIPGDDDISQKT
jgi:hypothetical protein